MNLLRWKIIHDKRSFGEDYVLKKYEQEVKGKLTTASEELKVKIDLIEIKQVEEKACNVFDFIEEHLKANHLENVINSTQVKDFAGLKINLTTEAEFYAHRLYTK